MMVSRSKGQGFGSAPGKMILFGEHAVVYGIPAIAIAINRHSFCKVYSNPKNQIDFHFLNHHLHFRYSSLKELHEQINPRYAQFGRGLTIFLEKYNLTDSALNFEIATSLWSNAGLGSSASLSVAFIAALADYFRLTLSRKEISALAFEMEQIPHGKPSGIDNTTCTFGGTVLYSKNSWENLKLGSNFSFLVINSGEFHRTKDAVAQVTSISKQTPEMLNNLFGGISGVVSSAEDALKIGDLETVIDLVQKNQLFLEKLQLCTPKMEEILVIARSQGIRAIKMTGAGMGGALFAVDTIENLSRLNLSLNRIGIETFHAKMDEIGVIAGD